jgi:hypothetical protein
MRALYKQPLPASEVEVFPRPVIKPTVAIPRYLCCSITGLILVDPVIASDNQTYEREAIEEWLRENNTSPLTRAELANKTLNENMFAKGAIDDFLTKNPQLKGSDEVYLPKAKLLALRTAIENHDLRRVKDLVVADHRVLARYLAPSRIAFHAACEVGTQEILDYILSQLTAEQIKKIIALPKPDNYQPQAWSHALLAATSSSSSSSSTAGTSAALLASHGTFAAASSSSASSSTSRSSSATRSEPERCCLQ